MNGCLSLLCLSKATEKFRNPKKLIQSFSYINTHVLIKHADKAEILFFEALIEA